MKILACSHKLSLIFQELQELQRQYVHLEMALDTATNKRMPLFGSSEDSDNKSTSADDG